MHHTNFNGLISAVTRSEARELAAAVKAVGGEWRPDYEDKYTEEVIVTGVYHWQPYDHKEYGPMLVTGVTVGDDGKLRVFGHPADSHCPESRITQIVPGGMSDIIEAIPPTAEVESVSDDVSFSALAAQSLGLLIPWAAKLRPGVFEL